MLKSLRVTVLAEDSVSYEGPLPVQVIPDFVLTVLFHVFLSLCYYQ